MNVLRVLLADHEPASRLELETLLKRWGFEVLAVKNGRDAWAALEQGDTRLALLDTGLPTPNGFELCRQLRARAGGSETFIILMTPDNAPSTVAEIMNAGADDFLARPVQAHHLHLRLQTARRIVQMQNELRARASIDTLTGLWNHAMVLEMFNAELKRAERDELPVSIVLTDVDRLKQINDFHGHGVGDEILHCIAERMRVALRSYYMCGRYGGEEFLVVLPRCGKANAMEVAGRVRAAIADKPLPTSAGEMSVTVSCGVATTGRGQPVTPEKAIKAADEALFRAKRNGRNCIEAAVSIPSRV